VYQPVRTSGAAIASLVFGIVSWVFLPFIGALVAVICGHVARGEIRRQPPGTLDGDGLAIAGLVLGYIQLALTVVVVMVLFVVLGIGIGLLGSR